MSQAILNGIAEASKVIGNTWPLYSFVASNPLSRYESTPFQDAVSKVKQHLNAHAYPTAELYRQALKCGAIDRSVLQSILNDHGFHDAADHYLNMMATDVTTAIINESQKLDSILAKWLSSFMDEGLAEWEMPFKSEGFFTAWRLLVVYDSEIGTTSLKEIPKTSMETLEQLLSGYTAEEIVAIFTHHLAALPGWTGYINHRTTTASYWQQEYPISLMDYLAARLWTAQKINVPLLPKPQEHSSESAISNMQHLWLKAWEQTWQNKLIADLNAPSPAEDTSDTTQQPDAQLVFCIDTRSELIRRHVEASGHYETFGYAGFFGIAMDYHDVKDGIVRKSCPPIVASAYTVSEKASQHQDEKFSAFKKRLEISKFKAYFLNRMKHMLPSAFGYVEGSGWYYGLQLLARTILPGALYKLAHKKARGIETICQPEIHNNTNCSTTTHHIPLQERVAIVTSAFHLMGWKRFAPLVIFAGHGSHSANNPFGSSLDCGACAASPGRHNARMLAQLANQLDVRKALTETHHIKIPDSTLFIGAEHNTTTDAIELFDAEIPNSHIQLVEDLKFNLMKAQKTATRDRLGATANSVSIAQKKAYDWGETRPEWGLAKNAGFIIGPRRLTHHLNLDSRCFLHSYDWELDDKGRALEAIMQGPMVVTQWINNHYYFSTVDNHVYGGGTKITHNITGKFGVVQGNGGDLKMGLPLQSLFASDTLMYHQPLRLTVMIEAPVTRVSEIIVRNAHLKTLLDNEWIHLLVTDPTQKDAVLRYQKSVQWVSLTAPRVKKSAKKEVLKESVLV